MGKLIEKLINPFSYTSYIPEITFITNLTAISYAIPIKENSKNSKPRFSVIHTKSDWYFYFASFTITLFYTGNYCYWFYTTIYNSPNNLQVWQVFMSIYFLFSYLIIFGMQATLLLRRSEFQFLLETLLWIEETCIKRGKSKKLTYVL